MAEPTARSLAAEVLTRTTKEKAYAAAVLDAKLASLPRLDARDKALTTELVYGVLRTARYLDERIARFAPRGLANIDDLALTHLRLAAYQILFLDRIPAFAAVTEAVSFVRSARSAKLGGFVNAVLRRLTEEAGRSPRVGQDEAAVAAAPSWLVEALSRALGAEGATAFIRATSGPPSVGVRVLHGEDRSAWRERLAQAQPRATVTLGGVSPYALLVRGAGDVRMLPGYDEGAWTIEEEGAQVVALSLGARPKERVLDACAGRGNKTALLAELVGPEGHVDAADLHPEKLERLRTELQRLGVAARSSFAVDWTIGTGQVEAGYDRVLVDAPCSGVGTLRRRPEIALRRSASDLPELTLLQTRIAVSASTRLGPGGVLVYAVCSVLREEAEDVVERVLASAPSLEAAPFPDGPVRSLAGLRSSFRLLPQTDGTDGYFLASFVRR